MYIKTYTISSIKYESEDIFMSMKNQSIYDSGVHEECGVFGIYDRNGGNVAKSIYYGLSALQHRGQESCGIAVSDTNGPKGVHYHKELGLVSEVFKPDTLEPLHGNIGVGHVRYSTTGAVTQANAQPLVLNYMKGTLALAHNGNLVNMAELRKELEYTGAIFHTTIDSEVIAYQIARNRVHSSSVEESVYKSALKLKGAYSLVIMSPRKLIGVRDPWGLKPLCLGKRGNSYVLASESCALTAIDAELIRDIEPGEIITITSDEIYSDYRLAKQHTGRQARCIFEYIYFARLDSKLDGFDVYDTRIRAGAALARSYPVTADLVVGVPDSGICAAQGYARESGIPFGIAFHKNSYMGRTFIKPTQSERESAVKIKLSILESVVRGKRIILVDDSIVRGTTIKNLILMLKQAGALEVHVRISSPPFLHPCYFGTDVPSNKQLIAHAMTPNEICSDIGADSLGYLQIEDLQTMVPELPICTACFTANYPMDVSNANPNEEKC